MAGNEMLKIMVAENVTQNGTDVAAITDSLSAITEHVGYELLKYPDWKSFKEHSDLATIVTGCKGYDTARGMLLKGEGLGSPIIRKYAGEDILGSRDTRTAYTALVAQTFHIKELRVRTYV